MCLLRFFFCLPPLSLSLSYLRKGGGDRDHHHHFPLAATAATTTTTGATDQAGMPLLYLRVRRHTAQQQPSFLSAASCVTNDFRCFALRGMRQGNFLQASSSLEQDMCVSLLPSVVSALLFLSPCVCVRVGEEEDVSASGLCVCVCVCACSR